MDFDIFDLLKKLAGGNSDPQASQVQLPQTGPVPMARPDTMTTGSVAPVPMAAAAGASAAPAASSHPFAGLFQKDPTKQDALSSALLNAGASMMVAGGPSRTPTNLLQGIGQGIGAGSQTYQGSLKDARDAALDQLKMKTAQQQLDENAAKAAALKSAFSGGAPGATVQVGGSATDGGVVAQATAQRAKLQSGFNNLAASNNLEAAKAAFGGPMDDLDKQMGSAGYIWTGQGYVQNTAALTYETAKSKAEDAGKTTGDQKEYAMYVDQTKQAGGTPDDFTTWTRENKKASATKITNNNGTNNSKFVDKSDEKAADRYDTYSTQANTAQTRLSDLNQLSEMSKDINFGAGTQWKLKLAPYAQAGGLDIGNMGPAQAWQAIVSREAPAMRPVGSGSTSDKDMALYMASWPQLSNSPEGNAIIIATNKAIAEHDIAAGEIANRVHNQEISWVEGDKLIAALPSPFAAYKDFTKNSKAPAKVMGQSTEAPATADAPAMQQASVPRLNTTDQDAYSKLPSGSQYYDPNGVLRRKK